MSDLSENETGLDDMVFNLKILVKKKGVWFGMTQLYTKFSPSTMTETGQKVYCGGC